MEKNLEAYLLEEVAEGNRTPEDIYKVARESFIKTFINNII